MLDSRGRGNDKGWREFLESRINGFMGAGRVFFWRSIRVSLGDG